MVGQDERSFARPTSGRLRRGRSCWASATSTPPTTIEVLCTKPGDGALAVDGRGPRGEERQAAPLLGLTESRASRTRARHGPLRLRRPGCGHLRRASTFDHGALIEYSWAASAYFAELGVPSVVYLGRQPPRLSGGPVRSGRGRCALHPAQLPPGRPNSLPPSMAAHPGSFVIYEGDAPPFADPRAVGRAPGLRRTPWIGLTVEPPPPQDPDARRACCSTPAAPPRRPRRPSSGTVTSMSYLFGTGASSPAPTGGGRPLVSVPPVPRGRRGQPALSNLYAGRRIIYLDRFDPETWLRIVRDEKVTQAMVVPTMLAQIVDHLRERRRRRHAQPGHPLVRRVAHAGNGAATGLWSSSPPPGSSTPTASPRRARPSPCSARRTIGPPSSPMTRRSGPASVSVGRLVPGIELEVRDDDGHVLRAGPDRPALPPGRADLRRVRRGAPCSRTTGGSPPAIVDGSTTTATSSSRVGPTTPSSAVARTSPRPRSRTCSCPTTASWTPSWSGCPTTSGASGLVAVVVAGRRPRGRRRRAPRPGAHPSPVVQDARGHRVLARAAPDRHRQAAPEDRGRPTHRGLTSGLRTPGPVRWASRPR